MKTQRIINLLTKGCGMLSPVQQSREVTKILNSFSNKKQTQIVKAVADAFKVTCPVRYFGTYPKAKELNAKDNYFPTRMT